MSKRPKYIGVMLLANPDGPEPIQVPMSDNNPLMRALNAVFIGPNDIALMGHDGTVTAMIKNVGPTPWRPKGYADAG